MKEKRDMEENRRRSVLVIDDTPEDIAVLNEELKTEYRVQAATDHEAAMKIARSLPPPDLILLDVVMPGMDGYKLCRKLKAEPATRDIPVIFVTVKEEAENEAMGFVAGCVDYISKPVNPLLVRARVKAHVELKLAREELQKQNETLRKTALLREEIEAINRHDMKNPLMIVMSVPRMLLMDSTLTESQRKLLQMIDDAGRRMLEMINNTIDMYKMEEGTYSLKPKPVNVVELIEQIKTALDAIMDAKGIALKVTFRGNVPEGVPFLAMGEDLLLYSMLANLLKNAVEASPPGGRITISLDRGDSAVIVIHNMGSIPENIRGCFFEKFTTAGKDGGTGLGAYSAKLIAHTLGGTIDFTTSEEAGTTLTVRLPRW
jgi:two-component system sensor histidine kinase/response regulator